MKRLISIIALSLLAGCANTDTGKAISVASTPVGAQAVADARNTLYGLESLYGVTVQAAVAYARLPSCTPPGHPPACSSDAIVIQAAAYQIKTKAAIDHAKVVVLSANPDTTVLAASIKAAREAYDAFKAAVPEKKGT